MCYQGHLNTSLNLYQLFEHLLIEVLFYYHVDGQIVCEVL